MSLTLLNRSMLIVLSIVLCACASHDQSRITDAATTPLSDLNLVHTEIPAVLAEAQKQPYAIPSDMGCDSLTKEVKELDAVLGPDLDTPATESNPGLIERGSNETKNAAVGALQRTTEGVVPFRGWIRKLSGAESYSRNVAAAIAAGTVRRAFIKGLRVSRTCA